MTAAMERRREREKRSGNKEINQPVFQVYEEKGENGKKEGREDRGEKDRR